MPVIQSLLLQEIGFLFPWTFFTTYSLFENILLRVAVLQQSLERVWYTHSGYLAAASGEKNRENQPEPCFKYKKGFQN